MCGCRSVDLAAFRSNLAGRPGPHTQSSAHGRAAIRHAGYADHPAGPGVRTSSSPPVAVPSTQHPKTTSNHLKCVAYTNLRRRNFVGIEKMAWNQLLRSRAAIWAAITDIENASETTMPCSLPQDLVHGLSPGQFIHQLVQVTDLLHELILDLLHPIAADHAGDLGHVRVDPWCPGEESLEVDLLVDLLLQRLFIVAREPVDDGMHLLLRTTLLLHLGDVMRVDARERHSEYSRVVHGLVARQSLALWFNSHSRAARSWMTRHLDTIFGAGIV